MYVTGRELLPPIAEALEPRVMLSGDVFITEFMA
ncbi:hypothetical protein LCGC14_1884330, partial [marine sediment metagenome]